MGRSRRIKSFDDFSAEMQGLSPDTIAVQASRVPTRALFGMSRTITVGAIGDYSHGLAYTVQNDNKQKVHWEPLFSNFQSEHGVGDDVERNKRIMAVLLAGEIRVGQLTLMLAETDVYLAGPDLKPIAEEVIEQLHEQAQEYEVTAPDFTT